MRRGRTPPIITPSHPEYDEARQLHDIARDARPAAIVRAQDTADVVATVRFAAANGYSLAVRGGGHSVAGHSSADGALVLDLAAMNGVGINPETGVARVQGGATSADLAGPAYALGFAFTTGDTSSVGLGGLVTGGGIGWMVRRYGLALDNLLSAQVVTADGSSVTASPDSHPDLFWAIRGGGGNFGVVTEFEFQLAPVDTILGGAIVLPASAAAMRQVLEIAVAAPRDLTVMTNVMHAPPAPFIPAERVGELCLLVMICWTGDPAEGEKVIAPLRAIAKPIADAVGVMPYPAIYQLTEMAATRHGAAIRSAFARAFSDAQLGVVVEAVGRAVSPISMVQFRALGGAMADVAPDATAFRHRDKPYLALVAGLWMDPNEDPAPHRAWAEETWKLLRPAADGFYVNFLEDEGEARVEEAYTQATLRRLEAIKLRYDPTNFFRLNQNVKPRP